MAADPQPDDVVFAGLLLCSPSEHGSPVGGPGHLVDTSRSLGFLDAQPCPEPADTTILHSGQIGDEFPQSVLELGLLLRCQPFQIAPERRILKMGGRLTELEKIGLLDCFTASSARRRDEILGAGMEHTALEIGNRAPANIGFYIRESQLGLVGLVTWSAIHKTPGLPTGYRHLKASYTTRELLGFAYYPTAYGTAHQHMDRYPESG